MTQYVLTPFLESVNAQILVDSTGQLYCTMESWMRKIPYFSRLLDERQSSGAGAQSNEIKLENRLKIAYLKLFEFIVDDNGAVDPWKLMRYLPLKLSLEHMLELIDFLGLAIARHPYISIVDGKPNPVEERVWAEREGAAEWIIAHLKNQPAKSLMIQKPDLALGHIFFVLTQPDKFGARLRQRTYDTALNKLGLLNEVEKKQIAKLHTVIQPKDEDEMRWDNFGESDGEEFEDDDDDDEVENDETVILMDSMGVGYYTMESRLRTIPYFRRFLDQKHVADASGQPKEIVLENLLTVEYVQFVEYMIDDGGNVDPWKLMRYLPLKLSLQHMLGLIDFLGLVIARHPCTYKRNSFEEGVWEECEDAADWIIAQLKNKPAKSLMTKAPDSVLGHAFYVLTQPGTFGPRLRQRTYDTALNKPGLLTELEKKQMAPLHKVIKPDDEGEKDWDKGADTDDDDDEQWEDVDDDDDADDGENEK